MIQSSSSCIAQDPIKFSVECEVIWWPVLDRAACRDSRGKVLNRLSSRIMYFWEVPFYFMRKLIRFEYLSFCQIDQCVAVNPIPALYSIFHIWTLCTKLKQWQRQQCKIDRLITVLCKAMCYVTDPTSMVSTGVSAVKVEEIELRA